MDSDVIAAIVITLTCLSTSMLIIAVLDKIHARYLDNGATTEQETS